MEFISSQRGSWQAVKPARDSNVRRQKCKCVTVKQNIVLIFLICFALTHFHKFIIKNHNKQKKFHARCLSRFSSNLCDEMKAETVLVLIKLYQGHQKFKQYKIGNFSGFRVYPARFLYFRPQIKFCGCAYEMADSI